MRLKSYFAASVDAAMQQARQELGDEAMLLDSRAATGEARHLGGCEVIFALPDRKSILAPHDKLPGSPRRSVVERNGRSEDSEQLTGDLVELRREIHQIREAVARTASPRAPVPGIPADAGSSRLYNLLVSTDLSPDIAESLLAPCLPKTGDPSAPVPRRALDTAVREQISRVLRAQPESDAAQANPASPRLVAFVGPPGSGKTSALVKVAIHTGLQSRKPLLILSFDNYRVASAEQLRAYACILGVSFRHVETIREIQSVLEEHRHKHWIFIDTPGCGPRETEVIQELSEVTKLNSEMETHLVLSASMKSSDLRVAVERFTPLNAGRLLFTHLDETAHYGGVLTAAACSGKPISYLSFGQRIPEDLEAATPEKLMSLVFPDPGLGRPCDYARSNQAGSAAAGD